MWILSIYILFFNLEIKYFTFKLRVLIYIVYNYIKKKIVTKNNDNLETVCESTTFFSFTFFFRNNALRRVSRDKEPPINKSHRLVLTTTDTCNNVCAL